MLISEMTTHNEANWDQEQPVFLDPGALVGLGRRLALRAAAIAARPLLLALSLPLHLAMHKAHRLSQIIKAPGCAACPETTPVSGTGLTQCLCAMQGVACVQGTMQVAKLTCGCTATLRGSPVGAPTAPAAATFRTRMDQKALAVVCWRAWMPGRVARLLNLDGPCARPAQYGTDC